MTVRRKNYEKEKNNLLVCKNQNGNGYYVTNLKNFKIYRVTKDETGKVSCTCPDHIHRGTVCKHQIAVKEAYIARQEAIAIEKANRERTELIIKTVEANGKDASSWKKRLQAV